MHPQPEADLAAALDGLKLSASKRLVGRPVFVHCWLQPRPLQELVAMERLPGAVVATARPSRFHQRPTSSKQLPSLAAPAPTGMGQGVSRQRTQQQLQQLPPLMQPCC